jgi:transposase
MSSRRLFTREFKTGVVEEYLSGRSTAAQLSRRHEISPQMIYRWKKQYANGHLTEGACKEDMALKLRVLELEKLVVELSIENQLLKKARDFAQQLKNEHSSIVSGPRSGRRRGGVK